MSAEKRAAWLAQNPAIMAKYRASYFAKDATRQPRILMRKKLRKYGLTKDQLTAMQNMHGGVCAICKKKPKRRGLNIDHCHKTGDVRGLLCAPCNLALAAVDGEWLGMAQEYLGLYKWRSAGWRSA